MFFFPGKLHRRKLTQTPYPAIARVYEMPEPGFTVFSAQDCEMPEAGFIVFCAED